MNKREDKIWLEKRSVPINPHKPVRISEDSFLIVMNGANKDPYRKGFLRMFTAIQIALDRCPEMKNDLRVYVHSWMRQARDLPHGAKVLNVDGYCKATADYHNLCGVPEDGLVKFYGAADVFMHLSEGGGFEIPLLEAMSCGLPVITSDFICMSELGEGHGWLVPAKTKYFTPLDALAFIADESKAADALIDAYLHPEKRVKYSEEARRYALNFDWGKVNPRWIKFFEDIREEMSSPGLEERKI